jgi:hypothetical protein
LLLGICGLLLLLLSLRLPVSVALPHAAKQGANAGADRGPSPRIATDGAADGAQRLATSGPSQSTALLRRTALRSSCL